VITTVTVLVLEYLHCVWVLGNSWTYIVTYNITSTSTMKTIIWRLLTYLIVVIRLPKTWSISVTWFHVNIEKNFHCTRHVIKKTAHIRNFRLFSHFIYSEAVGHCALNASCTLSILSMFKCMLGDVVIHKRNPSIRILMACSKISFT
jgi:hypothetical protein